MFMVVRVPSDAAGSVGFGTLLPSRADGTGDLCSLLGSRRTRLVAKRARIGNGIIFGSQLVRRGATTMYTNF